MARTEVDSLVQFFERLEAMPPVVCAELEGSVADVVSKFEEVMAELSALNSGFARNLSGDSPSF
jgi:hypothetical protein